MSRPPADVEVDEDLVRALLADQHPDLAGLPLVALDAGWDNVLWRLGERLLVRVPRRAAAAPLTANEQRWLPVLAPRLPLPVPAPLRTGRPADGYPWPWSVVPWFDGTPGDRAPLAAPDDAATRLGRFLRALHAAAPPDAPANPVRGGPLAERAGSFERLVGPLGPGPGATALRRLWAEASAAPPWAGAPVWVHGDLHPANVLMAGGTVAAVLDWGDLCAGDPATDLAAGWLLLPVPALDAFAAAYGDVDDATWSRARGWAALFALMLRDLDGRPTYRAVARATLDRLLGAAG